MLLDQNPIIPKVGIVLAGMVITLQVASADESAPRTASPANEPQATGRVVLYGVETTPYFVLSEMPGEIDRFTLAADNVEALRELILTAADRRWTVHVNYIRQPDERKTTAAYHAWVDTFPERPSAAGGEHGHAKQMSEKLLKMMLAKNVDGIMTLVDFPFYLNVPFRKPQVLCDRSRLRALVEESVSDPDNQKGVRFTVERVLTHQQIRDEFDHKDNDEDWNALKSVLRKGDRMLFIKVTSKGKPLDKMALLVGPRNGEPKIVGLRD